MDKKQLAQLVADKVKALPGAVPFKNHTFPIDIAATKRMFPSASTIIPSPALITVFEKGNDYHSACRLLQTQEIDLPVQDRVPFAIYEISSYIIQKHVLQLTSFKIDDRPVFDGVLLKSIVWDLQDNVVTEIRAGKKGIPMRVHQPWNSRPGSKYINLDPQELRAEPMVAAMIEAQFYAVSDYLTEYENAYKENSNHPLHISLSWTELLHAKSIKEIKETKWKKIQQLTVNKGKFNIFQLNALKNMRPYITWEQTDRFIQALRDGAPYTTNAEKCITLLLTHLSPDTPNPHIINDTIDMLHQMRKRLDIKHPSADAIYRLHNHVTTEHQAAMDRKTYRGEKNILTIHEKFAPLVKALDGDARFIVLTKALALLKEGRDMNHCVASYVSRVNGGQCIIAQGRLNNERATIEFRQDIASDCFYPEQIQLKHNQRPSQKTYDDVHTFLDSLNPEKLDYSQFGWDYHG